MILGIMSFFGITLTLPGIAGLVLGMGMAVDPTCSSMSEYARR